MMLNIPSSFAMCSFVYVVLLTCAFFSKKRVNSFENKIYGFLVISNLIGVVLDNLSGMLIINETNYMSFGYLILTKIIFLYFLTWLFLFMSYVFEITLGNKWRTGGKPRTVVVIYLTFAVLQVMLPLEYVVGNGFMYPKGLSVVFLYFISVIIIIIMTICTIFNAKNVKKKKLIPLIAFYLLGFLIIILQNNNPSLILLTSAETFVTFLMYFTIENPDVKMIEQLEIAKDQANRANQAKTDFLSSMSHEIRTPLNAIVGFSDCIIDAKSLEEAKENAQDIVNASQTLLEIVNGILDISKIEAGKIEIINSNYNAHNTFLELAKLITPKMREKGLDFSFNIAADLPNTLCGDHANIKKVVTNLLSNACKYTESGFVHYEVNCVNSNNICKLIISVEDSGQGIKNADVDKLFTKFQRLDEEMNATIEGTGLGLAITKQLIELMGGKIIVHTVYGSGSKFTIVVNQKIEKDEVKNTKKLKSTLDLKDVKILIVDDTQLNLKVATKLFEKYNANMIDVCDSGFLCLEKVKSGKVYDVILLDDMMPKMSGVETLKKLKEIPKFNIPVVAMTANAISGMREKYLEDGFDDYLAKPIEKEQLIQVLNNILGRSITESIEIPREEMDEAINFEENPNSEVASVKDVEILDNENSVPTLNENESEESFENDNDNDFDGRDYLEKNGVDIEHALELLGDMEMYNMTLEDFLAEVEDKWNNIISYRDNNDMKNYAIEVHSLKSDCKYLGFMTLADLAYQHELKSKEEDINFVNNNFYELDNEYKKVLEIAKTYVNKINL